MIFSEIHRCQTDRQGRVTLPKLFRTHDLLREEVVCIRPGDGYFVGCGSDQLVKYLESKGLLDPDDEEIRERRRAWMFPVKTLHIDPQGRIPLCSVTGDPPGSIYVLFGTGVDFEIWHESKWNEKILDLKGDL